MANPHVIRYATTDDGVSIAFWEAGEGKPILMIHNFAISHAELEWSVPSLAAFYTEAAKRYRIVRFDPRGAGMSDDPPGGWGAATPDGVQLGTTLPEMGLDIEAVVNALDIDSFSLFAVSVQVPVAIEFAVRHPELVTELVLWNGMANVASSHMARAIDLWQAIKAVAADPSDRPTLVYGDWAPEGEVEAVRRLMDAQITRRWSYRTKVQSEWNVESLLSAVTTPTLVICSSAGLGDPRLTADSRQLAASIPNARLRTLTSGATELHWSPPAIAELDRFLDTGAERSGFRTVVVTDIVESTRFLETVGDEAGREAIRELEQRTAQAAASWNGRVVKNLGDGSLVSFRSNTDALEFCIDLQDEARSGSLQLRFGVSAGEPLQEEGDIHGAVVAQASRIADIAGAGEVLVADCVRQLAIGKRFGFESMGVHDLKGFSQPCRVWKVASRQPR